MWDINLKATNEQDKQRETHQHRQWTSGYQRVGRRQGEVDGVKGVKYVFTEGNITMGEEHAKQYIFALLLNSTPETYWILLTNVTHTKKPPQINKQTNKKYTKKIIR